MDPGFTRLQENPGPAPGASSFSMDAPFYDPYLAELQRQLQHQQTTGVADLNLQSQRLQEDTNLMRPFMERRFGQQSRTRAEGVAGRGFHGNKSGIMRSAMGELAEDQAFTAGQFNRNASRGQEDIQRAIMDLIARTTMQGAEGVNTGAGNASSRAEQAMPF